MSELRKECGKCAEMDKGRSVKRRTVEVWASWRYCKWIEVEKALMYKRDYKDIEVDKRS